MEAASLLAEADFVIMTSAPPISFGEEILHEQLTDQGLDQEAIDRCLADTLPSGFEPRPDIELLTIPAFGCTATRTR